MYEVQAMSGSNITQDFFKDIWQEDWGKGLGLELDGFAGGNLRSSQVSASGSRPSESPSLSGEKASISASANIGSTPEQAREQMTELFLQHLASVQREVDPEKALEAYKLRRQGKAEHEKNLFARFTHIDPEKSAPSRSRFNKESEQKFRESLNRDFAAAEKGWSLKGAGGIEGLHSTAVRVVTTAASGAIMGIGGPLASTLLHEIPSLLINPALSGVLRVITQVEQILLRKGGSPAVTRNIRGARPMGQINADLKASLNELRMNNDKLRKAGPNDDIDAMVEAVARSFIKADTLQTEYTERAEMAKIELYGKGWGAAVNATGVVASGLAFHNPAAAVGVLAGTIPLQVAAGAADEKNKQHATIHGDAKYPKYMAPGTQYKPAEELDTQDVLAPSLKQAWTDYPQARFNLIRVIARHRLANAVERSLETERHVADLKKARRFVGFTYHREKATHEDLLRQQIEEIRSLEQQIDTFESIVETIEQASADDSVESITAKISKQLENLDPKGLIGRCLQERENYFCFRQGIDAMLSAPGELAAQILQRYAQNLHALLSIGVATGVHDVIGLLQGINREAAHIADIVLVSTMGPNFVANTGAVRLHKAEDKQKMAAPRQNIQPLQEEYQARSREPKNDAEPSSTLQQEKADLDDALEKLRPWVRLTSSGRVIDLTATAACDRALHTRGSRVMRVLKSIPAALVSGPVGAINTTRAKATRTALKSEMEEAVRLLRKQSTGTTTATSAEDMSQKIAGKKKKQARTFGAIREAFIQAHPWKESVRMYRELAAPASDEKRRI
jgi:hypothetical protein